MNASAYQRFKNTFESAYGQQSYSPFSKLLTGQIDYAAIGQCLDDWKNNTDKADPLLQKLHTWLASEVDPERIENTAKIPDAYLQDLRKLDCMRARIPKQYGGLGVSQCRYSQLLEKLGSHSEVLALVVSVQQLGVAQGLLSAQKLESRPEQQQQGEALRSKYLKQLATNAIGAFCLTTPETGSDPSRLQTIATASDDGSYFELSGDWRSGGKLFTTLGTIADVYIMLAVVALPGEDVTKLDPRKRITAFIVEREYPGITIKSLAFCGWHGLPNAAIKLDKVRIPKENIVGEIGDGLKIAFMNLGSGRINIAAISLGMMKQLERVARWWGVQRIQGGKPIGEHELNTGQLVSMNAFIYATEAFLQFVSALADQPNSDIRLEAAMLKLFSSHALVDIADETLQLRGGRGYESYASQASRGETAVAVERLFRSARMMKIGEGGSNVLKLYIMRCLLSDFLKDYQNIVNKELSLAQSVRTFFTVSFRYIKVYFKPGHRPKKHIPQSLYQHLRYVGKAKQRLLRIIISKIIAEYLNYYRQTGLNDFRKRPLQQRPKPEISFEQGQVLLGHCAEIATLLAVMTVTCQRAAKDASPEAIELADEFSLRVREMITIHEIKIANHHRKRADTGNKLGAKIMQGGMAAAVEKNIVKQDLPNIR